MTSDERRQKDREYRRAKRAAMNPEERAEARRDHDAAYRDAHREERRRYDRERLIRKALGRRRPNASLKEND